MSNSPEKLSGTQPSASPCQQITSSEMTICQAHFSSLARIANRISSVLFNISRWFQGCDHHAFEKLHPAPCSLVYEVCRHEPQCYHHRIGRSSVCKHELWGCSKIVNVSRILLAFPELTLRNAAEGARIDNLQVEDLPQYEYSACSMHCR